MYKTLATYSVVPRVSQQVVKLHDFGRRPAAPLASQEVVTESARDYRRYILESLVSQEVVRLHDFG